MKWADRHSPGEIIGLPDRRKQFLLYANLKGQFKEARYWSGEQHASASDNA